MAQPSYCFEMNNSDTETSTISKPNWLNLVKALGWVSFFADVASEMLYPITPIFLSQTLGASMSSIGLIEGVAEFIANVLKTKAGALSDKLGKRKGFVFVGYLISGIGKPLIGFASSWPGVLFGRGLDRFGKGIRGAPRDAMIADGVPAAHRGAAFGLHRGMDTAGAAIGPLLAVAYLHFHSAELRPLFYWSIVPGLVAAFIVLLVREPKMETRSSTPIPALNWKGLSPGFRSFLFGWAVFSVANSSDVFLLMRAQQQGLSLIEVIFLYCFYNLIYALLSPVLGAWSDRIPRKRLLTAGLVVFALTYSGFAFAESRWVFILLFGIYGIYMASTDGVGKSFAVDLLDPQNKGAGLGLLGSITGFAAMLASLLAGALWDHYGSKWCFLYGALGALLAAILIGLNKFNGLEHH